MTAAAGRFCAVPVTRSACEDSRAPAVTHMAPSPPGPGLANSSPLFLPRKPTRMKQVQGKHTRENIQSVRENNQVVPQPPPLHTQVSPPPTPAAPLPLPLQMRRKRGARRRPR